MIPIIISIIPPHNSARSFRAMPQPHLMPNNNPINDTANETNPMIPVGGRISEKSRMPKKAKETPMAKASMLVAIAMVNTLNEVAECTGTYPAQKWH